jgi:hypothetical protein
VSVNPLDPVTDQEKILFQKGRQNQIRYQGQNIYIIIAKSLSISPPRLYCSAVC